MWKWLISLLERPRTIDTEPAVSVEAVPNAVATLENVFVEALREEGFTCRETADGILMDNGLVFTLEYLESQPIGENALRTVSKVSSKHPVYFPEGLYEFQHASGGTEVEALLSGFRSWAQTDLATLVDSIGDEGTSSLVMEIPQDTDLQRKVFMGPYVHHVTAVPARGKDEQCHDFCPCCLFTNSIEAFREHLADQAFFGIRLYACRDDDGMLAADCRVNGEDFPAGAELLKKYAATWPPRGLEFRKQYVVIRNAGEPAH